LVLLADQFEELFASCPKPEQAAFLGGLAQLVDGPERATLLITVRADFYDPLLKSPLGKYLPAGQVNISRISREELEHAITQPAERVGLELEAGLAHVIAGDLSESQQPLPLLEFTLRELWERGQGGI